MRAMWQVEAFTRKGQTQLAYVREKSCGSRTDVCELPRSVAAGYPLDKEQNVLGVREVLVQLSSELPFARAVQHLE